MMDKLEFVAILFLVGGYIFNIYKTFTKPDISNEKDIALIKQGCLIRHKTLDDNIFTINRTLNLIQENDLKHIESEIKILKENQIKIFTILDERLPKKKFIY